MFIDTIDNAHSLGEAELLGFNEKKRATKALFCMNQPEIKSVDIADGYNLISCALYSPLSHRPFFRLFPTFPFSFLNFTSLSHSVRRA